jgi:hypothetical protein
MNEMPAAASDAIKSFRDAMERKSSQRTRLKRAE